MTPAPVTLAAPRRWHDGHHWDGRVPFDECWWCQRARAKCRSKRAYETREEAEAVVAEVRIREEFSRPVARYHCRWCGRWHLTTHPRKLGQARHERQRRKHLFRQELARRAEQV